MTPQDKDIYPLVIFEGLIRIWEALPPARQMRWRLKTLNVAPELWAKLYAYILLHPVSPVLLLPDMDTEEHKDAKKSAASRRQYFSLQERQPIPSYANALERAQVPPRDQLTCAWCDDVIDVGTRGMPVQYGICKACLTEQVNKRLKTKRSK